MRMAGKAARLLTALFHAYHEEPMQLPLEVQARIRSGPDSLERVICDYLAGMTDRYAISEYSKLFDPEARVERAPEARVRACARSTRVSVRQKHACERASEARV